MRSVDEQLAEHTGKLLRKAVYTKRRFARRGIYSQSGQDVYVCDILLANKRGGFFIDIGAHDGITYSNTYYPERELGWDGICVEPNPQVFAALQRNRHCSCVHAALGERPAKAAFLKIEGYTEMLSGLVSTYDERHLSRIDEELREHGGTKKIVEVPCTTFDALITTHSVASVDYLSIDTEGGEYEILRSIDFPKVDVRVIGVENNFEDYRIEEHLRQQGFKLEAILDADEIYVNRSMCTA